MAKGPLYRRGQWVTVYHRKPGRTGSPIQMGGTVAAFDGDQLLLTRRFKGPGRVFQGLEAVQGAGDHGTIELRRRSWLSRRRYLRADGTLIGELFNVQGPTRFGTRGVEYLDLELDVAYRPHLDEPIAILGREALDAAVAAGHVPPDVAEAARHVAEALALRLHAWDGTSPLAWDVSPPNAQQTFQASGSRPSRPGPEPEQPDLF